MSYYENVVQTGAYVRREKLFEILEAMLEIIDVFPMGTMGRSVKKFQKIKITVFFSFFKLSCMLIGKSTNI